MTAALILLVFLVFAALMYTRTMPALLAVPLMAVVMAFAAGVPGSGLASIVLDGAPSLAKVIVTLIFGAMLGRVTLDTGIARAIVNAAAEFGGESPAAVAFAMCVIVALLFVSLQGLGAIIMVGTIVLPVMMTTGVPRKIAATLFLMAFALGFIFNPFIWQFYTKFFGITQGQLTTYAAVLAGIDALAMLVYAIVSFRSMRAYATWAVKAERIDGRIFPPALVTPVLPIVLFYVLRLDPILAFALSAIYGVLCTKPRTAIPALVAAAIRGIEDVAPAVLLFIGIGMLATAVKQPQFAAALQPIAAWPGLRSPVAFIVLFGLLSPLVLYRGPLNPFGVGIAIFTVLLAAHALPAIVLVAAMMAVVQVQNVCDPTNTQNVWVANFTGVHIDEITKRTLPFQAGVATAACIAVVAFGGTMFGTRAFGSVIPPAAAAEMPAGMFVDARSSGKFAVGTDGSSDANAARGAVVDTLRAAKLGAFAMQSDPNASDCSRKPYAAYVTVSSTRFALLEGTDVDIGVSLQDCGGWSVGEWHDHAVFPSPSPDDARSLGAQGAQRLLDWSRANPERWQHLVANGLAFAGGDGPTYYYSLFKTVDGNMRAFVRGGGPAYAAGLRSNDIVDKLDGSYWWEFGTYQTQARAYDGKPHSFDIERGGKTLHVQLGEAFSS